jgi:hypothetical protein
VSARPAKAAMLKLIASNQLQHRCIKAENAVRFQW